MTLPPTPHPASRRRGTDHLWMALASVTCAAVLLAPVAIHPGWPSNHNGLLDFTRIPAFLGQWRLGHPLVSWSTAEQWGFGSPAPALYNKSFYYVAAAGLALTGSLKAAMCAALAVFMIVAFLGADRAVREVTGQRDLLAGITAGALVVSCNYATTDWLVRSAVSEFAALSLTPWLFAWCLRLIVRGRWSVWIGPILALVTLGHVIIGLFSLIPLLLAVGLAACLWARALRLCRPRADSAIATPPFRPDTDLLARLRLDRCRCAARTQRGGAVFQ
ncbi:hypothetical protein FHR90_000908 [Endobacter medicaginis]|uniref:Transmembrane protein n=1 Tax=Endobacter medicaginis TaxID=1181271 RepID=A0A839UY88_9PROT|nr:hypothetical protein [Endobacter medicaginis]MBB3173090.1 hypothetical protein [Endobacter medicaginis]MCX5474485.1 hypothetical protein [Endobacter medicaginis]NVN31604.1 hypothetical protein [Endobacter medicaginis]